MDPAISFTIGALVALALGLFIGVFLTRGRVDSAVKAATSESSAQAQVEIATLKERIAAAGRERQAERDEYEAVRTKAEGWRSSLDAASNEIARLTERASRVSTLESQVTDLSAAAERVDAEMRNLATTSGQNAERAALLAQQIVDSSAASAELQGRLDASAAALHEASEARVSFEQQAQRVPLLEIELSTTRRTLDTTKDELTAAKEAAGSAIARLTAEVAGERDALALVREEVTTVKSEKAALESRATATAEELSALKESSGKEISKLTAELAASRDALAACSQETAELRTGKEAADARISQILEELTELRTRTDDERVHAQEKLQMLGEAREALTLQFKNLANEILEEKSKRFAEQNQATLGQLLDPLRTQLSDFKGKVEEVYVQEGKDRTALREQVSQLMALNNTLSQEAKNLTSALKGQAKVQGNWGEHILETVLEASGLQKGIHYKVQESQTREDGSRAIPDVIIELPEGRKLVVDAKVSLVAYERYVTLEDDAERKAALKQHLDSVQAHIKSLSDKKYSQLYAGQSLDFVLAFVPIEPAFTLAVTSDRDLFMSAWDRNVLMVSPSTLLFVVRTVAHLWRQEAQSKNAQEIAKRGAALFDKLSAFVTDLQKVGERLGHAQQAFNEAQSKLVTGQGNAIRQAQMLIELGVKGSKPLPTQLVEQAIESDAARGQPTAVLVGPAAAATPTAPSLPLLS